MEFDSAAGQDPSSEVAGCAGAVCVAPLELDGLKERELVARLVDVARARAAVDGLLAQVAGRLVETNGRVATAWIMREYTRVSGFQARCDTALAGDLTELDLGDTVAALSAGEITRGPRAGDRQGGAEAAPQERIGTLGVGAGLRGRHVWALHVGL